MICKRILLPSFCALALTLPGGATAQGFEVMKQENGAEAGCEVPRPPKELDSFAYVRNGYREILRVTAIMSALEEEFCGCPFEEVDWQAVVGSSEEFKTSNNPKLPFDVIELRDQADALESQLEEACSG